MDGQMLVSNSTNITISNKPLLYIILTCFRALSSITISILCYWFEWNGDMKNKSFLVSWIHCKVNIYRDRLFTNIDWWFRMFDIWFIDDQYSNGNFYMVVFIITTETMDNGSMESGFVCLAYNSNEHPNLD